MNPKCQRCKKPLNDRRPGTKYCYVCSDKNMNERSNARRAKKLVSKLLIILFGGLIYATTITVPVRADESTRKELQNLAVRVKAQDDAAALRAKLRADDAKATVLLAKATSADDIATAHRLSPRVVPDKSRDAVVAMVKTASDQTFGPNHWPAMYELVMRESGFQPWIFNKSSGACGLFQALPCSKIGGLEIANQIKFGMGYIKNRYGTPTVALAFHHEHNWY